ncbi:MAG: xanthine dehydrogenase family protein molybdopterin-binding subunit [Nannocystaceae bacterium]
MFGEPPSKSGETVVYALRLGFDEQLKTVKVEVPKGEPRPWDADAELRVVGKETPRVDGPEKVSGAATYTHDVRLPGMLHAAILRSPHAAAEIEHIDVGPALKRPGVKAAIPLVKVGARVRFAGADIAAVAATSRAEARAALAAIDVRFRPLPFVVDPDEAMQPGAPEVHQGEIKERRTEGDEPSEGGGARRQGNVRMSPSQKKGNAAKGLRQAKVSHDATYTTQVHTHAALETHSIVVRWDSPTSMTAWCSTQGIFSVRDELANVFELRPADVRVHTPFMGGGFGAKFGASAPGSRLGFAAGELARKAKAPVSLLLDRHEEHVCTGNRPSSSQRVSLGASPSGALTGIHVVAHGSAGIATGAGVGNNAFGIYTRCPNILVESRDVFCNTGPGTAFRAPGHPQGGFAIELALDELAAKVGKDPLALRLEHVDHPVRRYQLELGRERFAWAARREAAAKARERGARMRRGVGVACSIWGDYGRAKAAHVTVSVDRDGAVEVRNGVQDIGGGITTVLGMVVAEVLQRPLAAVRVRMGDSELGPSVGSGGSQTTSSVAPAARNAAEGVKAELSALAAGLLDAKSPAEVVWGPDGAVSTAGGRRSLSFAELCKKIPGDAVVATATRPKTYGHHPVRHPGGDVYQIAGAQFVEVLVDTWTGVVTVPEILAIHDAGRIHNPLTCRSQVNGGVALGLSYALTEARVMDRGSGRMLNPNLETYKIVGTRDMPKLDVIFTEVHTGANSTGAIGIGEPATIPTAAAIACAVFDAVGHPVRSLPITPDKVLRALEGQA